MWRAFVCDFFPQDTLLASVTHDLKTPLNGILVYSQLSDYSLSAHDYEDVRNNLQIIQKNGILLQNLIMDILDFS